MSDSKGWPMTFIAVRCPHCQSEQIVKRGKTRRGTQRYLCQNTACTTGSFLLDYRNRGCLPEVKQTIVGLDHRVGHLGKMTTKNISEGTQRGVASRALPRPPEPGGQTMAMNDGRAPNAP